LLSDEALKEEFARLGAAKRSAPATFGSELRAELRLLGSAG
jgi:hypothetical protein